jgi:hypothetical protein
VPAHVGAGLGLVELAHGQALLVDRVGLEPPGAAVVDGTEQHHGGQQPMAAPAQAHELLDGAGLGAGLVQQHGAVGLVERGDLIGGEDPVYGAALGDAQRLAAGELQRELPGLELGEAMVVGALVERRRLALERQLEPSEELGSPT